MIEPLDAPRPVRTTGTVSGVTFMPWWYSLSHNALFHRFSIGANGIEVRVIRTKRYAWDEMERVELRPVRGHALLTVRLRGRLLTFNAHLATAVAQEVLDLFPASVPRIVHAGGTR